MQQLETEIVKTPSEIARLWEKEGNCSTNFALWGSRQDFEEDEIEKDKIAEDLRKRKERFDELNDELAYKMWFDLFKYKRPTRQEFNLVQFKITEDCKNIAREKFQGQVWKKECTDFQAKI